ncbi:MAG: NAD(P)-dependent alcohol dehydrogenase [Elusimicrobia bacterium]|nr:NAD(P)-dependent alcohol dehydrogenase [Elusimicrobiota bacterium]
MKPTKAYAAHNPAAALQPFDIQRREPGPKDVEIEIAYCGVCHSDIHMARNEWSFTQYPVVPGHEIVGRVTKTGAKVRRFKAGDAAAIGCLVNSCRKCPNCKAGLEQHCKETILSYNSKDRDGTITYGGYLLCAGITTYSPLKRFGVRKGSRLGVLGLGGLGHMGVKIGAALGAEVTVLSHSAGKRADAKRLGAHEFALTSDAKQAAALAGRFDVILDTVSADHDITAALGWLKIGGTVVLVGASPKPLALGAFALLGRKAVAGSLIGGIAETQEMLDFCARRKVLSDVEVVPIQKVNEAYERTIRGDVRYRFVIDLKSL